MLKEVTNKRIFLWKSGSTVMENVFLSTKKSTIMTLKWPHLNIYELHVVQWWLGDGGSALYSFYKNLLNMNIPPSKAEHAVAYLDLLRTFDQYEEEIRRTIGKESKYEKKNTFFHTYCIVQLHTHSFFRLQYYLFLQFICVIHNFR